MDFSKEDIFNSSNPWALHLGRDPETDTYYLCLANNDEADAVYTLAEFESNDTMAAFCMYMETQGYLALKLPTDAELNEFFD